MEQAKGHTGNNIVTVLMREKNIGLQAASDFIGEHFKQLMSRFVETKQRLPSFGANVDAAVAKYVAAMEYWVVGNLVWIVTTSALLVGLPLALSLEDEAKIVAQEKEMLAQQQGAQQVRPARRARARPACAPPPARRRYSDFF